MTDDLQLDLSTLDVASESADRPTLSWAWLAGFFDGEGTITMSGNSWHWSVAQSHDRGFRVLTTVHAFLREQGLISALYRRRNDGCHCLYISKRSTITLVLSQLMPHLQVKKVEAQDALRHMRLFPIRNRGKILGMRVRETRPKGNVWMKGDLHPKSKLRSDDVRAIRDALSKGVRKASLARAYGIGFTCIVSIQRGRTWTSVS